MATTPTPKKRLTLLSGSWQYFDLLIVLAAVVLGFAVWFIPSMTSSPEVRALFAKQEAIAAEVKAEKEAAAAIKKEQDDLGLVFMTPTTPPQQTPAKPEKKPAKAKPK